MNQATVEFLGQPDKGNHLAFHAMLGLQTWISDDTGNNLHQLKLKIKAILLLCLLRRGCSGVTKGPTAGLGLAPGAPGVCKSLI